MDNDIRDRRLADDLTQAQLAAAMGVSRQTINSIEAGRYLPSLPLALALARFFDVPVEEMFHADHTTDHTGDTDHTGHTDHTGGVDHAR